jgi:DnaK suppressor protein
MARKDSILKMRELLVKRRDALRRALAGDLSNLKSLSDSTSGDVIDAALDAAQDEISSKLAEVESRERMKGGGYGLCEVCNGKIPLARLQALPYATNCIECQRANENAGGGMGYGGDWGRVMDGGLDADISFSDLETT